MNVLRVFGLAALAAVCLPGAPKETPPSGTAPKPFKLPPTEDFSLPNGLKVTLAPYGAIPKVSIRAFVDAGAVREPADKIWLSRLTAALLKEGTTTRSGAQLANEAADMGGQLEIHARRDSLVAGGIVLTDFGSAFAELLADVLQNASLPEAEVPRLKADLIRELTVEMSQPATLARQRFFQTMFPNQPYGRIFPTKEALAAYQISDVRAFATNLAAARTHVYVVGQFDPSIKDRIRKAFGPWKAGRAEPIPAAQPVAQYSLQQVDRPGAPQSTLYIGLPVPNPKSPDYVTLDVMDSILGGSFASRITSNIREDKGYTYSPSSAVSETGHQSYWAEVADVTTAVTGPSIQEIFSEVKRLRKEAPTPQEVKGIQGYLSGLFVLKNTISPDAVILQLRFVDFQELDRSFLSNYVQKVNAVSSADIQRVAESYITPSKMTVVVVGDKAKIADQIKPFESAPQ